MAKHTITVQANGMTYKVETDADTFMIGGVEFKFQPSVVQTVTVTSRAIFIGTQTTAKKIACIKAVREASYRRKNGDPNLTMTNCMGLREAKELVESGGELRDFPGVQGSVRSNLSRVRPHSHLHLKTALTPNLKPE